MSIVEARSVAEVSQGLWLGPMPDTLEFIRSLRYDCGVTAVVSVQTRIDLLTLGFSWRQMNTLLRRGGISTAEWVPIPDFDEASLAHLMPEAIEALHRVLSLGHTTYLHCTAGLNRSPTVAIGYLVVHRGLSLEDAWDQVTSRRRVIPLRAALERWLEVSGRRPANHRETNPG